MKNGAMLVSVLLLCSVLAQTLAVSWPLLCGAECQLLGQSVWCDCSEMHALQTMDKRGVRLPFRFGKRGGLGKRQQLPFRYGKRSGDDSLSPYDTLSESAYGLPLDLQSLEEDD